MTTRRQERITLSKCTQTLGKRELSVIRSIQRNLSVDLEAAQSLVVIERDTCWQVHVRQPWPRIQRIRSSETNYWLLLFVIPTSYTKICCGVLLASVLSSALICSLFCYDPTKVKKLYFRAPSEDHEIKRDHFATSSISRAYFYPTESWNGGYFIVEGGERKESTGTKRKLSSHASQSAPQLTLDQLFARSPRGVNPTAALGGNSHNNNSNNTSSVIRSVRLMVYRSAYHLVPYRRLLVNNLKSRYQTSHAKMRRLPLPFCTIQTIVIAITQTLLLEPGILWHHVIRLFNLIF